MRILFGHQRFGAQSFGGVTRYFAELASALSSLEGIQAEVFSPFYVSEFLDVSRLSWPGGRRVRPFPGAGPVLGVANLAIAMAGMRRRPGFDIYHETYYSRFDCAPRGSARVVTVFDMIHELFPSDFPALDRTRQAKVLSIRRADHIICISRSTQVDLVRILGIPQSRTSVVHLASSLASAPHSSSPRGTHKPYLLYVGQRSSYKNFDRMLRAYASSLVLTTNFRLLCFGGGGLTRHELELCRQLGLPQGSVEQTAGNDEMLAGAYAGAAMLVYPSLYEGFGLPPLEAMSLGCPVVCSDTSSIPEVVGMSGQYFDPTDIDSIRTAMELVADSPSRRDELIASGQLRSTEFSWRRCAEQTLEAYQRIAGAGRASSLRK